MSETRRAQQKKAPVEQSSAPGSPPETQAVVAYPPYIYGLHEPGGEHLMREAGRIGWVLHLAAVGLDGTQGSADFRSLADQGFGIITRLNHGYGSSGTLPTPDKYPQFAAAAARYVARSHGCHIWIVGNEPNHEVERPNGRPIYPAQYALAYAQVRAAIRRLPGHGQDLVLVAGSAPWNATTAYPGNEKGDWIRYFVDVLQQLRDAEVDGFAIHTYTHDLNPQQITGDFFHTQPGYTHLRNEFRTYRDYMNAIPDRFRHLPVFITETDPTTRHKGWNPGANVGWVQAAYREISAWNSDPDRQPIQALILYRWPVVGDQPEWSISNRPGVIEDFRQALRAKPEASFAVRLPGRSSPQTVIEPGQLLPKQDRWTGTVTAELGLNLRTGPSTQHTVIQILPNGALVMVLAELDDWLYVEAVGKTGYVHRSFIRRQAEEDEFQPPEGGFLRTRAELIDAPLAPPAERQISLNSAQATWTEIVVANTWNQFGALILKLAEFLDLDPAVAVGVMAVESGGTAFAGDGRMLIRFENHIFFDKYGKLEPERFSQHFQFNLDRPWEDHLWRPDPKEEWRTLHGNHQAEWNAFNLARTRFDPRAAKLSISMGLPQIMGFNHRYAGYESVEEMFTAFRDSANAQIIGFFDFIRAEPIQIWSLRNGDFYRFAAAYNGAGQAQHYSNLITDAARTYSRLITQARASGAKDDATAQPRLPYPPAPPTLETTDPELYAAWREHMVQGFRNNQEMFDRVLKAFMDPYNATVRMYRMLFGVGLASFVVAVALSIWTREAIFALVFGGLTAASFITYFLTRPLRSLEENLNFITWLGVIYNSYWARLVYATNLETIQEDLKQITEDFVTQIERLIDRNNRTREDKPEEG
ncbi:MAG: N-acetylmuramidase domain-containing protein [Chloroflexota bacterium]|nr:N-acetylmuramidase domain-containing protein [Chloroflexota bacterium]